MFLRVRGMSWKRFSSVHLEKLVKFLTLLRDVSPDTNTLEFRSILAFSHGRINAELVWQCMIYTISSLIRRSARQMYACTRASNTENQWAYEK